MDAMTAVILAIVALLVGLAVGWFAASRSSASLKVECDALRERCGTAERESAAAGERAGRAEQLQKLLDAVTGERDEAIRSRAALEADARNFDVRMTELREAKETLVVQFREIGDKLLEKAHQDFLAKADDRLAKADKDQATKLQSLLQPVEATLKRYEANLTEIEKARNSSYGELKQAVVQLAQGNDQVRRETQRLANVMVSSPKARGRWGEEQLRTILESAGLAENVDFTLQTTVNDGDRTLRPDCIVNLPGGRCIVIDVKCPLVAFEQAYDEDDDDRRLELLLQHSAALKSYASDLGKKSYWQQFERSPDFVIMFVPGEHFLSAAAERAPKLIEEAFRNGVIIASTINMLALAKIMAGMWRQESLATQAKEIAEIGKELHARLQTMGSHVVSLGRNLRTATDSYNDFVGSLDAKVLTQAKKFEDLKVADGNKPIIDPPQIDFTPKVSRKLPISDEDAQIAAE